MKNRVMLAVAATFLLLAAATPVRFDSSGFSISSAMARGGADDGAGHDAGDNHGGHGNDGPNHR